MSEKNYGTGPIENKGGVPVDTLQKSLTSANLAIALNVLPAPSMTSANLAAALNSTPAPAPAAPASSPAPAQQNKE